MLRRVHQVQGRFAREQHPGGALLPTTASAARVSRLSARPRAMAASVRMVEQGATIRCRARRRSRWRALAPTSARSCTWSARGFDLGVYVQPSWRRLSQPATRQVRLHALHMPLQPAAGAFTDGTLAPEMPTMRCVSVLMRGPAQGWSQVGLGCGPGTGRPGMPENLVVAFLHAVFMQLVNGAGDMVARQAVPTHTRDSRRGDDKGRPGEPDQLSTSPPTPAMHDISAMPSI